MTSFYLRTPAGCVYTLDVPEAWRRDPSTVVAFDDSGPVEILQRPSYPDKRFTVITRQPVGAVVFHRTERGPITGWKLDDPTMESQRFPAFLSDDAGRALRAAMDDEAPFPYAAIFGEPVTVTVTVDTSGFEPWPTEGAPRPELPDGAAWYPAPAWAQVFGIPTHDHIVPGRLTGFHQAALNLIAAHPNCTGNIIGKLTMDRDKKDHFDGHFKFRYSDGRVQRVKATPRSRTKTIDRPLFQTVRVDFTIGPDEVHGPDIFEALIAWERRLREVEAQIPEPSLACAYCNATGFVRPS